MKNPFNRSHAEHLVISIGLQLALAAPLLFSPISLFVGGVAASFMFLGRELKENEFNTAHKRGWVYGQVPPVKWWEPLIYGWSQDRFLDWFVTAIGCSTTLAIRWSVYIEYGI